MFRTVLARNLAMPRILPWGERKGMEVIAEGKLSTFEVVVCAGHESAERNVQRCYVAVRGPDKRVTTFMIDIPLDPSSEAGARVFSDRRHDDEE